MASNTLFEMEQKKTPVFEPLGEGFAKKGNRIYLRVQKKGQATWLSTKTDKLPQARKWKENWQKQQWLQESGVVPPKAAAEAVSELLVDQLLNEYVEAGHPIIRKSALKRKAARSIRNETYCLTPLRIHFGSKTAAGLALGDCDLYHKWRTTGGYVAKFKVRGNDVTRQTWGGDRAVDLELIVLSNALALAVRRGYFKANPLRDRGQYTDDSCCFGKHAGAVKTSRRALRTASGRRSVQLRYHAGCLNRYRGETAPARNSRVTTGLDAPALPWRGVGVR
jgi:hypothetical protein